MLPVPDAAPRQIFPGGFSEAAYPDIKGYRGKPGCSDEEQFWDPAKPPCIPSDERPKALFGKSIVHPVINAVEWLEPVIRSRETRGR